MKKIYILIIAVAVYGACKKKTPTIVDPPLACTNPTKADFEKIQIFPTDNLINIDISASAIDPNSAAIMAAIGSPGLHPDFGSGMWNGAPIGIPFSVVCGSQTKVPITFRANSYDGNYGNESDAGPYPVPLTAPIEGNGNGDSHVLTVDIENKVLYEMYNSSQAGSGWEASCGVKFDLKTNPNRTEGWTSADASGMAILPILVRYDEMASGKIDHCIRFTLSKAKVYKGYTAPASHKVNGTGALNSSLPMGAKLRLKSTFDISGYSANVQVILKAMKTYGVILTDIGSDMFISGAPDSRWNDTELQTLKNVKASNFEVVKMGVIK
ncbi:MAG: hypothetical protein SGJ10_13230 [Bacteroidota bacterium]|nr:hypothetical protein [Bacteroidota bacterium]